MRACVIGAGNSKETLRCSQGVWGWGSLELRTKLRLGWASFWLVGPPLLCYCRPDGGPREALCTPLEQWLTELFAVTSSSRCWVLTGPPRQSAQSPSAWLEIMPLELVKCGLRRTYFFNLGSCIPSAYTLLPCFVN